MRSFWTAVLCVGLSGLFSCFYGHSFFHLHAATVLEIMFVSLVLVIVAAKCRDRGGNSHARF
jgi:hypothetical protein